MNDFEPSSNIVSTICSSIVAPSDDSQTLSFTPGERGRTVRSWRKIEFNVDRTDLVVLTPVHPHTSYSRLITCFLCRDRTLHETNVVFDFLFDHVSFAFLNCSISSSCMFRRLYSMFFCRGALSRESLFLSTSVSNDSRNPSGAAGISSPASSLELTDNFFLEGDERFNSFVELQALDHDILQRLLLPPFYSLQRQIPSLQQQYRVQIFRVRQQKETRRIFHQYIRLHAGDDPFKESRNI